MYALMSDPLKLVLHPDGQRVATDMTILTSVLDSNALGSSLGSAAYIPRDHWAPGAVSLALGRQWPQRTPSRQCGKLKVFGFRKDIPEAGSSELPFSQTPFNEC